MDLLESYESLLPTGLASEVVELTQSLTLTSIPSTITQDLQHITSVLNSVSQYQNSAASALQTATISLSKVSLVNDIIQAQATVNYYSVLKNIVTETNTASKASMMTEAAQASAIMHKMFKENTFYSGNYPSLGGNIALLVVFSVFFVIQMFSGIFYHQWWSLLCWSIAIILEIIGYAGRIWSNQNISNINPFVMQLVCLTLAPCFMMAGIYYIIAQLTLIYGQKFSILRPMQYSLIFIVCDIISIILQAVGGGVASSALSQYISTSSGSHIMVGGLAYQVFTIGLFQIFWYYFLWSIYQASKKHGDTEFNPNFVHIRQRKYLVPFMFTVSAAVILIFVRSIYRLIELAKGWSSNLATDEIYFMILEALMVALATCLMTLLSPGLAYGRHSHIYIDKTLRATFHKDFDLHYEEHKRFHQQNNPDHVNEDNDRTSYPDNDKSSHHS